MTHAEAQASLVAYHANALDRDAVRRFHAHLKDCEDCRRSMRLRRADLGVRRNRFRRENLPPEVQSQMAKNRDLLIKVLLLGALAALFFRLKS